MLVRAAEVLGRVVFAGISLADSRELESYFIPFFLAQFFFVLLCPFRSVQLRLICFYYSAHII